VYPIVYGFFYLLSLLPLRVLYLLGDSIYVLVFYVIGYRKDVVMKNLAVAFPEKSEKERRMIAKGFYHNFIDTFIEMIKLISLSKKQFLKRVDHNLQIVNDFYASGKSVVLVSGHFFNWEFANYTAAIFCEMPFIGIYMKLSNRVFDKLIYKIRSRFGTILIATKDFKKEYLTYSNRQHAIGLVADQNPGNPANGYWYPFFGRLAPFAKGPEKTSRSLDAAIITASFYKVKRGYYKIECNVLTTTPNHFAEGEITRRLVQFVEECIRKNPSNYLWSHRRWKHSFDEEKYGHLVI
jgi:Kdo2-lipid IVA lauroyltransferase/acyltransferase